MNSAEVAYESLRPLGKIQIVLSGGEPLTEQDVDVRHSEGVGKAGLTSQKGLWSDFGVFLNGLLLLVYLWLSGRALAREFFDMNCRSHPAGALRKSRPFLISKSDWQSALEGAASRVADRRAAETGDVSSWEVYKFLDAPKPVHLTEDVWDKLHPILERGFTSRMEVDASRNEVYGRIERTRKLLVVPKPTSMLDEHWTEVMGSISRAYVGALIADLHVGANSSDLAKRFTDTRPDNVREEDWRTYRSALKSQYLLSLLDVVLYHANPGNLCERRT